MAETLTIFRICKTKYATTAFDGEGAFRFGGRWNSPGTRVIYTADSLALAAMEMLVHLDDDALLLKYSFVPAEIPLDLVMPISDFRPLPADWGIAPAPLTVQQIGDEWAREMPSAILEVPTSVVPRGKNYLLNPAHSDFRKIAVGSPEKFVFNERLTKK